MKKTSAKVTKNSEREKLLQLHASMKKRKPTFLRHKWHSLSSLGKGRVKKQKWRKPKGRHSKLREKKKSHGRQPSIGFRAPRIVRGTLAGLKPQIVRNVNDLVKAERLLKEGREIIAFLSSVGLKNKIEIAKKALEMNVEFANFNPKEFLKEAEKKLAEKRKKRQAQEEEKKKAEKAKPAEKKKASEKTEEKTEKKEEKETKPEQKEAKSEEKAIIKPKSKSKDKLQNF